MNKNALIIFIKNPIPGKVKTRLAADIGDEKALEIYTTLLTQLRRVTDTLSVDKFLFYSDYVEIKDSWDGAEYNKHQQAEGGLGERMKDALKQIFHAGYARILLIGSDIYGINSSIITRAYEELDSNDLVIGPAEDGGYYLIGMKQLIAAPFVLQTWSHADVLTETLDILKKEGFSWSLIDVLRDIDTLEDVKGTGLEALL